MKKSNRFAPLFLFILLFTSIACNFGGGLVNQAAGEISSEDISRAATRAAEAAAAAGVAADQASQLAENALSEQDSVLATAQALAAANAPAAGGSLEQKLANIQPDANGNFAVPITDVDLNEFIAAQGGALKSDTFGAEDIKIKITTEHVALTGSVTEPIALPLDVKLRPTITGDQLSFELLSATAGIFPVPDSMLDLIEAGANSELTRALAGLPDGVTLQNATLADGVLTIFGRQN